jgi:hypothetical protein
MCSCNEISPIFKDFNVADCFHDSPVLFYSRIHQ